MPVFQYWVSYQFTTAKGEVITGSSSVGAEEWIGVSYGQGAVDAVYQERTHIPAQTVGGMEAGAIVPVVYFPLIPEHNRLDESRLIPVLACGYIPFIALSIVSLVAGRGVYGGHR